jgi:uncharacterized membrane protein HdeD (DUF308 family)
MSTTPAVSPPPAPPAPNAGADVSAPPPNLERLWYLAAVSGVVSVVIGVLVLVYPDPSLKLLGVFLGIDLLLVAVVLIVRGARDQMEPLVAWLLGTLALIAGLLLIRNPGRSLSVLALAFAVWLVVAGALALGHGLVRREGRWATLARGAVSTAFGALIISSPHIGLKTLAVLAGISLILQGLLELGEAFLLRSLRAAPAAR